MAKERFKEQGEDSFFGNFVYQRVVPRGHFLAQLKEIIPWGRFSKRLLQYYQGKGQEGRAPYDPALLLRMLLVSYLYDLSGRQTEEAVNYHMAIKYFVGLAVDQKAPDHSTLTAFKRRLIENGQLEAYEGMLKEIVGIALEEGIEFGPVQVIDSAHTVADVNVEKDERRRKEGKEPRDPHARWGVKHSRRVRDEKGRVVKQREYFYGYKMHVSMNSENGMITSVRVTPGNAYDGHLLPELVEEDLGLGLAVGVVSADRGYDDSDNHVFLWEKGIHSAIRLNEYRTKKKDKNKEVWVRLKRTREYREGLKERYKVERKFGEAKVWHGLRRCRYVGIVGYAIQAILTAIVLNLKRMVKLLRGVNFRGRAMVMA